MCEGGPKATENLEPVYSHDLSCGYIPYPVLKVSRKTVDDSVDAIVDRMMRDTIDGKSMRSTSESCAR